MRHPRRRKERTWHPAGGRSALPAVTEAPPPPPRTKSPRPSASGLAASELPPSPSYFELHAEGHGAALSDAPTPAPPGQWRSHPLRGPNFPPPCVEEGFAPASASIRFVEASSASVRATGQRVLPAAPTTTHTTTSQQLSCITLSPISTANGTYTRQRENCGHGLALKHELATCTKHRRPRSGSIGLYSRYWSMKLKSPRCN